MSTRTETDLRQEATEIEDRDDALASFGLIHVVACTGAGVAVVLAIALVEWLA